MSVIQLKETIEQNLPGRRLRWYVGKEGIAQSDLCACNVVKIAPGQTVKPAHSHASCEEMIYIVEGSGEIFIDGTIHPLEEDSVALLERNTIHMLHNSGKKELKAICFFAPPTTLEEYTIHPEVEYTTGAQELQK